MNYKALALAAAALAVYASSGQGQTAPEARAPAVVVPVANQPPAQLYIDPPLPGPLASGRVIIPYRAENLKLVPVFGPAALDVSPRIGHIHVTVDDNPWRWADTSGEPVIINGLPKGPHKVLIELVDTNHMTLDQGVVSFVIP